jgi:hypothetical protein
MVYEPQRKKYRLHFEGAEYDGLEVLMKPVSTGELLDITEQTETAATTEQVRQLLGRVAGYLHSWNVGDGDGGILPATADGLLTLEYHFVKAIIEAWQEAVVGVDTPLPMPSNGTRPLPPSGLALSLPMEPLHPVSSRVS